MTSDEQNQRIRDLHLKNALIQQKINKKIKEIEEIEKEDVR
jgi:hypothetical protein